MNSNIPFIYEIEYSSLSGDPNNQFYKINIYKI